MGNRIVPFQFQMVQLKDAICQNTQYRPSFQFQMVQLKEIWRTERPIMSVFQFQMVQLKAWKQAREALGTDISIPNGSIKRFEEKYIILGGHRFQFQMVQLKDNILATAFFRLRYFNSKWFN